MGVSTIKSHESGTQIEGFNFYTALLALPSSGKTLTMKLFKNILQEIESWGMEKSCLVNCKNFFCAIK